VSDKLKWAREIIAQYTDLEDSCLTFYE
jgi:hypothetical protein